MGYIDGCKLVENFHAKLNKNFSDTLLKKSEGGGDMGPLCEVGATNKHVRVVVAVQYLVKNSFFRADEAPLEYLLLAISELDG
jgi:hypothetical protein